MKKPKSIMEASLSFSKHSVGVQCKDLQAFCDEMRESSRTLTC